MATTAQATTPKPPRQDPAAPDGVSTTGARPSNQGVEVPAATPKPVLETFEQAAQRGTDDARMMQRGAGDEPGGRATPDGTEGSAGPGGRSEI